MIAISFVAVLAFGAETVGSNNRAGGLFSESFDDAKLGDRQWYDLVTVRIAGGASAGKGCLEYEWVRGNDSVQGSAPMRRLFEPTDRVYVRFDLKLSKGFGWSGRN